ncbi:ABC transporter substrate-binding protein [Paenibacillus sp. UNC499MF]|uniref:ABC transporter substrate-binding protein n=1 Tax=Paenibacillus sp. UNC499MF TaxID=1502751 RepID=UPI00089FB368|nr:extracellular solute-binding protein [Paenibacillus sp. UNC499MF]SEF72364.1 multiple sugar transport system substrate-binding protein [Paenibacillus sp. UNC499MF]
MKTTLRLIAILLLLAMTAAFGGGGPKQSPGSGGSLSAKDENGKKIVVVSMLFLEDVFKEAEKKFEEKHPDVDIRLKYVQTKDDWKEGDLEKFVKSANTDLLSGNGPDILVTDPLPIGKYVSGSALANLSGFMNQDPSFHKDLYFGNILDNLQINGALYGIPVRFMLETMVGDEEAVKKSGARIDDSTWTWHEFAGMARTLKKSGSPAAYTTSPQSLLTARVRADYSAFVDEPHRRANFADAAFIKLLNETKALFDGNFVTDKAGDASFKSTYIQDPEEFFSFPRAFYKQPRLYRIPLGVGQKPGGFFTAFQTLGMNEKSPVKKEAWEFIKFMLSEEMQDYKGLNGFPLNKAVYEKQLGQVLKFGQVTIEAGPDEGVSVDVKPADAEYQRRLISELSNPVPANNSVVGNMLLTETKAFFNGQKSAEETAGRIQSRINAYLNE